MIDIKFYAVKSGVNYVGVNQFKTLVKSKELKGICILSSEELAEQIINKIRNDPNWSKQIELIELNLTELNRTKIK